MTTQTRAQTALKEINETLLETRGMAKAIVSERDALKHDIERHVKITSEQATENERLVSERDTALARVAELEAAGMDVIVSAGLYKAGSAESPIVQRFLDALSPKEGV